MAKQGGNAFKYKALVNTQRDLCVCEGFFVNLSERKMAKIESLVDMILRRDPRDESEISYDLGAYTDEESAGRSKEETRAFWERVASIFGDGMPSCGLTDAAIFGGSDDDEPASGTVYKIGRAHV